jgi:DNA-binding IclR family transcriptional regulator
VSDQVSRTSRALLLLEHVAAGGPPQTHGELMRELGVPRSTLSDLLAELRDLGYLQIVDRRYVAGPRLIALIHRGLDHRTSVLAGVRPALEQVAAATGETAVYVIRAGDGIVSLDQAPGTNPIRYVATLWEPFGLETTAPGMVFQAFGPDPPPHLNEVREQGYAVYAPDPSRPVAIAGPVRDPRGEVVGSMVVVGPRDRLAAAPDAVWPALRDGIRRLEAADAGT